MQSIKAIAADTPLVSPVPLLHSTCTTGMQEADDEKYWNEEDDTWDEATLAEIDSRLNQASDSGPSASRRTMSRSGADVL